jgi:hypothetical protein
VALLDTGILHQIRPEDVEESAYRACPFVPTARATGVAGPDAARISPFATKTEGEITQAELRAIVPVPVIVPPVRPVPAVTEVTEEGPLEASIMRPNESTVM